MIFNLKALNIYSTKAIKEKKKVFLNRVYSLKPEGGKSTTIRTIVYNILNNNNNKMTMK